MEKNDPLLSITIPTYNRRDYLVQNLKHLIPQLEKYDREVEVIISDNCSPIDYKKDIDELSVRYNYNIQYIRQNSNIGFENNIKFVSRQGIGDYVFIMGDDDILSPNFFDIIIPILRTHMYGAVHFGRLIGDKDCSNNILFDSIYKETTIDYSVKDFIIDTLSAPNFMSSIITDKRCLILGESYVEEKYYGYQWFANDLFGMLKLGKPCLLYYFPLVIMRNPQRGWANEWPLYAIVGLGNIFHDLDLQISGVYEKWIQRLHDNRFYQIKFLLSSVSSNQDFYNSKKNEFYTHLSMRERRFFNYWLWTPIPRLSRKIYFGIIQKISKYF